MNSFTNIQKNVLDGCLLGDGNLELPENGVNAKFNYRSSSKEHVEYVHKYFKEFCSDNYSNIKRSEHYDIRTKKTYVNFYFKTKSLSIFTEEYNRFYKNKIKIVPNDLIINKYVLLFWYIGDGELERKNGFVKLHTNSFTESEVDWLCSKLKFLNAKKLKKSNNHFLVTIPRNKVKNFLSYIGNCPIDDYKHKWKFVEYVNKNIEKNGINNHVDKYPMIIEDFKNGNYTIYELSKKYNVPIKSITHHFNSKNIEWVPKILNKEVIQCDSNGNEIKKWGSGQEIKRILNYNASAISECCRGLRKIYKNYIWKFKN